MCPFTPRLATECPSFLIRVSPFCCLFFRSGQSLATSRASHSRQIVATLKDLSDLLANNVSLTSKENCDIDVGGSVSDTAAAGMTYDLVGRVVNPTRRTRYSLT